MYVIVRVFLLQLMTAKVSAFFSNWLKMHKIYF